MRTSDYNYIIPVVPFCLDEWPNPEGYIHSMLLNHLDKFHQIIISFKIELTSLKS